VLIQMYSKVNAYSSSHTPRCYTRTHVESHCYTCQSATRQRWHSRLYPQPVKAGTLIYRPQKDERPSWPSWLICSGRFTHNSGHPSAAGRAQDRGSSPARDRRSTTVLRNQPDGAF